MAIHQCAHPARTRHRRGVALAVAALLLGLVSVAEATVALRLTLAELTKHSPLVVRVRCGAAEARWTADRTSIWTHHTLEVLEVVRAKAPVAVAVGDTLDVRTRGGTVGAVSQRVSGVAATSLASGHEVVVFLFKDGDGRWQVTGMVQGAFVVTRPAPAEDGSRPEPTVANSYAGLSVVDRETKRLSDDPALSAPRTLTLSALTDAVKEHAK